MKYLVKVRNARIMASALLIIIPLSLSAQNKPQKKQKNASTGWESDWNAAPVKKTTDTPNTSTSWDTPVWNETDFISQAKEGIAAEIEFGELALQKATNEATRNYARRLIDDYTKARHDLTPSVTGVTKSNATSSMDTPGKGYESQTHSNLKGNMDEFNVHGSGLGTGGGTTGTAVSRPDRPRTPSLERPEASKQGSDSQASIGSGTAGMTGSGFGSMHDNAVANPVSGSASQSNAGVELSTEHQRTKDQLNNLAGIAFDRQYLQTATLEQEALVKVLESSSNEASATIQQWTNQYLPIMRRQRDLAAQLKVH